jgi:hypothetical protein
MVQEVFDIRWRRKFDGLKAGKPDNFVSESVVGKF